VNLSPLASPIQKERRHGQATFVRFTISLQIHVRIGKRSGQMSFNRKFRMRAIALAVAVCGLGRVGSATAGTVQETLSDETVVTRLNNIIIHVSRITGTISGNGSPESFTESAVTVVSQDPACISVKRFAGQTQQRAQRSLNTVLEGYFNSRYTNFQIIQFDAKNESLTVSNPSTLGKKKILNKLKATYSGGTLEILVLQNGEFWYYTGQQTH